MRNYYIGSIGLHVLLLLVLVLGYDFATPLPVLENTNKNDVISAIVLGDTKDSKILPTNLPKPTPVPVREEPKQQIKPEVKQAEKLPPPPKHVEAVKPPKIDAIALKKPDEKKKVKPEDIFGKDLLADLEKIKKKTAEKKKTAQKKTKVQFEKTLREQAEKSLRQQLLNEDIKLTSTESRQAQGEINKYKALIVQAISEHWVVPVQANKKLSSVLLIRLAPGGVVLDVQISKSSGDPALDSSARTAVFKSSPLPVPKELDAFEPFRQFSLKVKPENIL